MKQILSAFQVLQHKDIIHRDIKLENLFLKDGVVKLGDFGFARELQGKYAITWCGSLFTMAPEVIESRKHGKEVDIYSLGVILYQMVFGDYPYNVGGESEAMLLK